MKERPILFTPHNAQLVHESIKTQTRRIIKSQPAWVDEVALQRKYRTGILTCPYGRVGDRLWVREAHRVISLDNGQKIIDYQGFPLERMRDVLDMPGWKHSLHMPRWACRTVVELTDVRAERLNDIGEADAKAEGCHAGQFEYENAEGTLSCRESFKCLWESIHGKGSWERNPWVWVLSFRKVEP